jgi:predicted ATPase
MSRMTAIAVVLTGPPGGGKSSVLDKLATLLGRELPCRSVCQRSHEVETVAFPCSPALSPAAHARREIARFCDNPRETARAGSGHSQEERYPYGNEVMQT